MMDGQYFTCEIHSERFQTLDDLKQHVLQHHDELDNEGSQRQKPSKKQAQLSTESLVQIKLGTDIVEGQHSIQAFHTTTTIPNPNPPDFKLKIEEEESLFQCHICSNCFAGESSLSQHLDSHVRDTVLPDFDSGSLKTENDNIESENIKEGSGQSSSEDKDNDENYEPGAQSNVSETDDDDSGRVKAKVRRKDHSSTLELDRKSNVKPNTANLNLFHKSPKKGKFMCYFCSQGWSIPSHILRHMSTHTKERPFICSRCPKEYCNRQCLKRHALKKHNIVPVIYNCRYCKTAFGDKEALSVHVSIHFGEVSHPQCFVCKENYKFKKALYNHIIIVHGITPDPFQPFCCRVCKKYFQDRKTLRNHMLTHSEKRAHGCPQCNKRYKRPGTLKIHIQTAHSKKKPFQCEYCSKRYNRKDVLLAHTRTQHIEKKS